MLFIQIHIHLSMPIISRGSRFILIDIFSLTMSATGMAHDVGPDLGTNPWNKGEDQLNNPLGPERTQMPELSGGGIAAHDPLANQMQLGHHGEEIEMGAPGEQEIPEHEDLGERGRAGAEREDGGESIDGRREAARLQEGGERGVERAEKSVQKRQPRVHPGHRRRDVGWDVPLQQRH
jgi:hypothetical protein